MTRFTDFDDFLRQQDNEQKKAHDEQVEEIKNARQQLDPWKSLGFINAFSRRVFFVIPYNLRVLLR